MIYRIPIWGVLIGCVLGFAAAEYFPLWGGIAKFGAPFSPARNSLVAGHIFAFAGSLCTIGLLISILMRQKK